MSETRNKLVWWCAGFMACVAGVLVWSARSAAEKALLEAQDDENDLPVEELASELKQAWSQYHTP